MDYFETFNIGYNFLKSEQYSEAKETFLTLLNVDKQYLHKIYYNLGYSYKMLNDFENAEKYFKKSINSNNEYVLPRIALHELYCYNGNWFEGFKYFDYNFSDGTLFHYDFELFEKRLDFEDPNVKKAIYLRNKKDISGIKEVSNEKLKKIYANSLEKVTGKTINIIGTQGLGDVIQCMQYIVKLLEYNPKKIILSTRIEIMRLFKDLDERIEVQFFKPNPHEFDYFLPTFDLIKLFQGSYNVSDFKLSLNEVDTLFFRELMKKRTYSIGINWKGNPNHINDKKRSLALKQIVNNLGDTSGKQIYSLQFNPTEEEKEILKEYNIIDLSSKINDTYDMACFIYNMDLFVTVDSAPAHIAGVLNKRTLCLIPNKFEDWRWGNTETELIYKNLKIVRF